MQARFDFVSPLLPGGALLFPSFDEVVTASALEEVIPALQRVDAFCKAGGHAAGYVCYEAAPAFDAALTAHPRLPGLPLVWFGLSRSPQFFSSPDLIAEAGLPPDALPQTQNPSGEYSTWQPLWGFPAYQQAFDQVQEQIREGESYQVNLTFPLTAALTGDSLAAYETLRRNQGGDYAAYLDTGDWQILSLSPELFFERRGNRLHAMPMKGTCPRGLTLEEDLQARDRLTGSEKERAENLMIVDLLRNDLGRLAVPGGVSVPDLLQARRYPTLWQLTSSVDAELPTRNAPGLADLFRALFPCGSVTGAPKARTMQIIQELEPEARGVYCGALGVVLPGGDCVFNVPIRTLQIRGRAARYSVGGGLVADAHAQAEYAECLLKSRVLTARRPDFSLLETILWTPEQGFVLLEGHLKRLRDSAEYFRLPFHADSVRLELARAVEAGNAPQRLRLLVNHSGQASVERTEYLPLPATAVTVRLAKRPVDSSDVFLYHKTTQRMVYETFRNELDGAFDLLLYNERGELTEGTITNIALLLDGVWWTPPVRCGLLGGVLRAEMVRQGTIRERVLHISDIARAKGLRLLNSVRGIMEAVNRD